MLTLITGASGSGKSLFAEQYIKQKWKSDQELFYVATMKPYGEETKQKIERHREQREGKGFLTIECYEGLDTISIQKKESAILLECLSNLLANAMYDEMGNRVDRGIVERIGRELEQLEAKCSRLVVVTNEVFSAVPSKWEDSVIYIRNLGHLNQKLAKKAEEVYEVIGGIPMKRKGGEAERESEQFEEGIDKSERRILVLGGAFQGKTRWARKQWEQREIVYLNEVIKTIWKDEPCEKEEIWIKIEKLWKTGENKIFLVDEIGYGLVSIDKKEREYRELVGRMTCQLAEQADEVYRVVAGIPQKIKERI